MIAAPSGSSPKVRCQVTGTSASASVSRCRALSAGLVSTRCTASAARNAGAAFAARNASAIKVPRPGPSSTRFTRSGSPICRHTAAAHAPISSPNIWLISGAVTKSPLTPNGSRLV
jgi:hypothetical protein